MKKKIKVSMFLFVLMLSVPVWSAQCVSAQRWCDLCAMDLQKYRLTKYILTMADGGKKYTCSIHCAAILLNKQKMTDAMAANYLTGNMINAGKAYYLVGSDIRGVMSKVSKLAFDGKAEATEFRQKHGGELTDFKGALNIVNLDMAEDIKMLREKIKMMIRLGRVVAETNSCFVCHGIDGGGGIHNPGSKTGHAPAWNTEEFALHIDSKAKLKEVILTGVTVRMNTDPEKTDSHNKAGLKMPRWKDFIKGKELHALVNYIWSLRTEK